MKLIINYLTRRHGLNNLQAGEKQTFRLHLGYTLLDNFVAGVLTLNEFVFLKSLHGSSYQLSFLFQFSVLVFIFLIFISEWLKRMNDKPKLIRITGLLTRAPLAILLFFPRSTGVIEANPLYHYVFLGLFLIYYLGNPVIFPTINLFLKNNYRHEHFGKLYSLATVYGKVLMLVTAFAYGMLLDYDKNSYTYVFALAAVAGVVSTYLLSKIQYVGEKTEPAGNSFWQNVKTSALGMRRIMKENVPFRHFELGFLFYGFAFMSTVTVMTLFFERQLGLNYFSVATYKNSYNIIALFLIPFFGRTLGKIDPRKFAAVTFASIMLYLLSLVLTAYLPQHIQLGNFKLFYSMIPFVLFHAVFAATMSLLWNIGSAYFCKPHEAGEYQSVHLFLTATRAVFAPLLGVLFYELFGFVFTFSLGAASLFIAILIMIWSYRRDRAY
ncbi:MFS transporter [Lentimicrobium sp.]|jgi:Na+/melibiose symporter-like transporter|uniref:MFS transporter n=1 Tax=Lentimicrobium sp. TaxID=2034841 RepID=UPI0025DD6B1F|nr:MFS transporter [Lentimicrobium sp.]MCO5255398.1 MFS transporter [Lentimicrobium sp.]HPF63261.1 MFS transporter [Lentimicrobium sp.]HPR24881.1 MFS transporter [Lentimicrobium sp.]